MSTPIVTPYVYNSTVTKVYDGDTITVDINLGFDIIIKSVKIRLNNLNAPELKTLEGKISRDFLEKTILNKQIILSTKKDSTEKYGRYLGVVYLDGVDINQMLIDNGYAKSWDGKGVKS